MYSNNKEYRQMFRSYFKMDISELEKEYEYLKNEDPESYDELLYDNKAVQKGMYFILEKTKDDSRFQELYILSAGQLLSDNIESGLCVLLTYEYFSDFCMLLENPSYELFTQLKSKLK